MYDFNYFAELATYEDRMQYESWLDGMDCRQRYRAVPVIGGWRVERFTYNRGWIVSGEVFRSREDANHWIATEERLDELDNV